MKFPLRKMWPQLPLSAGDYPSAGLTHSYLIQAADHGIALESLNAEVSATLDPRAGSEGNENAPVYPQSITYTVRLVSSASAEQIARVSEAVEKRCPILDLLRRGNEITGRVDHLKPEQKEASAA